jgi:hypothetical protein
MAVGGFGWLTSPHRSHRTSVITSALMFLASPPLSRRVKMALEYLRCKFYQRNATVLPMLFMTNKRTDISDDVTIWPD